MPELPISKKQAEPHCIGLQSHARVSIILNHDVKRLPEPQNRADSLCLFLRSGAPYGWHGCDMLAMVFLTPSEWREPGSKIRLTARDTSQLHLGIGGQPDEQLSSSADDI